MIIATPEILISLNKDKWLILHTMAKRYKVIRASKNMEVTAHSKRFTRQKYYCALYQQRTSYNFASINQWDVGGIYSLGVLRWKQTKTSPVLNKILGKGFNQMRIMFTFQPAFNEML